MDNFSTVTVPAKIADGVKSGVTVRRGEIFTVSGGGRASYGNGTATYPDGTRFVNGRFAGAYMQPDVVLGGAPAGMLIARIGTGPWLAAGSSQTFCAEQDGEVIVGYNDRPGMYGDNSGEYVATIENHGSPNP
jgi:hypothetical protein